MFPKTTNMLQNVRTSTSLTMPNVHSDGTLHKLPICKKNSSLNAHCEHCYTGKHFSFIVVTTEQKEKLVSQLEHLTTDLNAVTATVRCSLHIDGCDCTIATSKNLKCGLKLWRIGQWKHLTGETEPLSLAINHLHEQWTQFEWKWITVISLRT